jgi:hypothetical protein
MSSRLHTPATSSAKMHAKKKEFQSMRPIGLNTTGSVRGEGNKAGKLTSGDGCLDTGAHLAVSGAPKSVKVSLDVYESIQD